MQKLKAEHRKLQKQKAAEKVGVGCPRVGVTLVRALRGRGKSRASVVEAGNNTPSVQAVARYLHAKEYSATQRNNMCCTLHPSVSWSRSASSRALLSFCLLGPLVPLSPCHLSPCPLRPLSHFLLFLRSRFFICVLCWSLFLIPCSLSLCGFRSC